MYSFFLFFLVCISLPLKGFLVSMYQNTNEYVYAYLCVCISNKRQILHCEQQARHTQLLKGNIHLNIPRFSTISLYETSQIFKKINTHRHYAATLSDICTRATTTKKNRQARPIIIVNYNRSKFQVIPRARRVSLWWQPCAANLPSSY